MSEALRPAGRTDPRAFRGLELRVHSLLDDVPLHDVWAAPLANGGPGRTIRDVRAVFSGDRVTGASGGVRSLFAVRALLGRLFGWDRERPERAGLSYLARLTEADRSKSLVAPGSRDGPFRTLYVFPNEAVSEVQNATVHAFSALALIERTDGYTLYWAIYVKPGSHLTRLYMAVIDPFRRLIVYPVLLRSLQTAWSSTYS